MFGFFLAQTRHLVAS